MFYNISDEELNYAAKNRRVRAALQSGIDKICDQCLLECKSFCEDLWFKVTVDTTDSHQYFPANMITDAICLWQERIDKFNSEIKRRNL